MPLAFLPLPKLALLPHKISLITRLETAGPWPTRKERHGPVPAEKCRSCAGCAFHLRGGGWRLLLRQGTPHRPLYPARSFLRPACPRHSTGMAKCRWTPSLPSRSPVVLSQIKSARLSHREAGGAADDASITIGRGFMGPFSVLDEREAYGSSATIGSNYHLHSKGLTMSLLKHLKPRCKKSPLSNQSSCYRVLVRGQGTARWPRRPFPSCRSVEPRGRHKMNRGRNRKCECWIQRHGIPQVRTVI